MTLIPNSLQVQPNYLLHRHLTNSLVLVVYIGVRALYKRYYLPRGGNRKLNTLHYLPITFKTQSILNHSKPLQILVWYMTVSSCYRGYNKRVGICPRKLLFLLVVVKNNLHCVKYTLHTLSLITLSPLAHQTTKGANCKQNIRLDWRLLRGSWYWIKRGACASVWNVGKETNYLFRKDKNHGRQAKTNRCQQNLLTP